MPTASGRTLTGQLMMRMPRSPLSVFVACVIVPSAINVAPAIMQMPPASGRRPVSVQVSRTYASKLSDSESSERFGAESDRARARRLVMQRVASIEFKLRQSGFTVPKVEP